VAVIDSLPDPGHLTGTSRGKCVSHRRLAGPKGRIWSAFLVLPLLLASQHGVAQDCSMGSRRGDWDDIERFRWCLERYGLDEWGDSWLLHKASRLSGSPTIVRLLSRDGWDPNNGGLTPLHEDARNTNPMGVFHLVCARANPNARDNEDYTAVHWAAAQSGNGQVVKVLLDRGADPFAESNDGRTPLQSALRYGGEPSGVSRMLNAGADEHLTRPQLSALRGHVIAVERLLTEGTDPNETDGYGWTALHFAIPLADLELVAALLAAGADQVAPTTTGATGLHLAASRATVQVVSALLSAGSDPNAREQGGRVPLHYGARFREDHFLPVITTLLEAGADPGSRDASEDDYGVRQLHNALMNPAVTGPVVQALLEAGADPQARDQDGGSPLHIAANRPDDVATIEALLAAGVDLHEQNEDGNCPVDLPSDIRGSEAYWRLVVPGGTLPSEITSNGSLTSSDAVWGNGSHYDVWAVTSGTVWQRVAIEESRVNLLVPKALSLHETESQ